MGKSAISMVFFHSYVKSPEVDTLIIHYSSIIAGDWSMIRIINYY